MCIYLLTYVAITTRLYPGTSALLASPPVGHTKRSQGIFKLVFPTPTRSSHPPMTHDQTAHQILVLEESSSIRTTWPSQRNRWILIRLATSMSLKSSYSPSNAALSNTPKAVASVLDSIHAAAPHRSTGRLSALREVSTTQLPIAVGKSYSALDFQADVVVCVYGGAKVYDNIYILSCRH